MTLRPPAAVLWDMDGTIVDTEPYWMRAETDLVRDHGGEWRADDAVQLIGQGLWHSARVLQARGVAMDEAAIIDDITDRVIAMVESEPVPWRPGARELLRELREHGVPTALVTMSFGRLAERIAAAVGFDAFDTIVAGDAVQHSKPHPQPYLIAAERLGVSASNSVAIEDSEPGLASAIAAGTTAVGVPAHAVLVETGEYTLWPTLDGRTVHDLSALHAERTGRTR